MFIGEVDTSSTLPRRRTSQSAAISTSMALAVVILDCNRNDEANSARQSPTRLRQEGRMSLGTHRRFWVYRHCTPLTLWRASQRRIAF